MPDTSPDRKKVFIVHGRNLAARRALTEFLRAVGLEPVEWSYAIASTGTPTPYIGAVLDHAFSMAQAVVVLITGDDIARLGKCFVSETDDSSEREFSPQARPNVLFEAGMAFGRVPDRTIMIAIGQFRPFSDIAGRHILHLNNSAPARQALVSRLATSGCDVKLLHNIDWLTAGDFEGCIPSQEDLLDLSDSQSVPMDLMADSFLPKEPFSTGSSSDQLVRRRVAFDLGLFLQSYLHLTCQKDSYFVEAKKSLRVITSSLRQCLDYFGIRVATPSFSTPDQAENFVLQEGPRLVESIKTHLEYAESDEVQMCQIFGGCVYLYSLSHNSTLKNDDTQKLLKQKMTQLARKMGITATELSSFFTDPRSNFQLPRTLLHGQRIPAKSKTVRNRAQKENRNPGRTQDP